MCTQPETAAVAGRWPVTKGTASVLLCRVLLSIFLARLATRQRALRLAASGASVLASHLLLIPSFQQDGCSRCM